MSKTIYTFNGYVTKGARSGSQRFLVAHSDLRAGLDEVMRRMAAIEGSHVAALAKKIGQAGLLEGKGWTPEGSFYDDASGEGNGYAGLEIHRSVEVLG